MPPLSLEHAIQGLVFRKCGEKSKTAEHNAFLRTKPQVAEGQNRGLVGRSRIFPALPDGISRKYAAIPVTPEHTAYSSKETASSCVVASCVLGMFDISRILPVLSP